MEITTERRQDIVICRLEGELDMYEAPNLHAKYKTMIERERAKGIILDLAKLTYLDSSGIGVLFQLYSDAKTKQTPFCLSGAAGMVQQLFKLSRMAAILPLQPDALAALDAIRRQS